VPKLSSRQSHSSPLSVSSEMTTTDRQKSGTLARSRRLEGVMPAHGRAHAAAVRPLARGAPWKRKRDTSTGARAGEGSGEGCGQSHAAGAGTAPAASRRAGGRIRGMRSRVPLDGDDIAIISRRSSGVKGVKGTACTNKNVNEEEDDDPLFSARVQNAPTSLTISARSFFAIVAENAEGISVGRGRHDDRGRGVE